MKTNLFKRSTTYFTLFLFTILLSLKGIAGGPPGGCSPAGNIACAAPTSTCSDPTFNAGSGGSINCSTATPINMPGCESSITGTTANSQDGTSVTYSCGTADGMVWFTFTAPSSTNNFTLTPGTLQNALIVITDQPCGSGTYNTCSNGTGTSVVTDNWALTPGQQAWIGVGSTSESHGTFTLSVESITPPPAAGDGCATANVICSTDPFSLNMNCATASGTTPSCFLSAPQQDTWITFTVLQAGTIGFTGNPNANAEFDWALWNISGGCPGILSTPTSCNYDFAGQCGDNFGMMSPDPGTEYNATVNATAGQVYAIQIDNFSGNGVGFSFDWTGTAVITPVASFTMNNDFSCTGSLTVDFTHTGVGNATYTFGNGNTYTGNNPPNQNYTTGTYAITATATQGTCTDVFTDFVTVYAPLSATITPTASMCNSPCTGSVSLSNVAGGDGIYTYLWSNGATTQDISNVCPGSYSVTISNATCGTTLVLNATVGVTDILAPVVTGTIPATNIIGCTAASAPAAVTTVAALEAMGVTIADNYTADASIVVTSTQTTAGTCPIVVTRTYTLRDACNNSTTLTHTININDNVAPTVTGTLTTTNVTGCTAASAPAAVTTVAALEGMGVTIADNCTADASLTVTSTQTTSGTCPIVITRTYTIRDACNNSVTANHIINVNDNTNPTVTGTIAATNIVGCSAASAPAALTTVAALEALGVAIADNCTADASLTVTSSDASAGTCPVVVTRTYTIRDACNNPVTLTQTFNINDNVAPTITGTIAATNIVGCSAASAPAAVTTVAALEAMGVTIADNCTADASLTVTSSDASAGTCPIVVTRTYTIRDACLNQVILTQTFNINDNVAPTVTGTIAPTNIVGCSAASAPAAVTTVAALEAMGVTIADNCTADASLTVTSSDASAGTCPIVVTRTYTIRDACLNQVTLTQTFNINDNVAPTVTGTIAPTNIVGCSAASAPAAVTTVAALEAMGVTIADNCTADASLTVTSSDASAGTCPIVVTRTYTIRDACLNQVTLTQTFNINDNVAPTVTGTIAATNIVGCSAASAPAAVTTVAALEAMGVTIADNCTADASLTVTSSDASAGTCPIVVTRTYTIRDACLNQVTLTQTFNINDNVAPTVTGTIAPTNIVGCSAASAPAAVTTVAALEAMGVTIADNCTADASLTVTSSDASAGTCPIVVTRTYTIRDACLNQVTLTQTFNINDNVAPTVTGTIAATNIVGCSAASAPAAVTTVAALEAMGVTIADNCTADASLTVTTSDVSAGSCPVVVTRTYTIKDACLNQVTLTQTFNINDNVAPTASNPAPISVAGGSAPPPDPLVVTTEADNCSTPIVAWVSDVSDGGVCPEIVTRTYSVTDACGNQITVTQSISIGDAIMPTASNPAPISVQCIANVPVPNPAIVTDEADNGATPTVTFESDASDGNTCPETITRTYRVTDDCGNFIFVTQTITVQDITAPVLAAAPANVTVSCSANVPAMTNLSWTDNCDGTGSVTGSDVSNGGSCPEIITRTWTYTDNCGNVATTTQAITVHDLIAPVFAAAPANVTVSCSADVPAMTNLSWTDNCDGTGSVAGSDVSNGGSCPEVITRTWTYTDNCGNVTTTTQTITVHDLIAPVFAAAPANVTVSCVADVPAMTNLSWTDNCDGTGSVAGTDGALTGGACGGTITRTWTYTDDCGNVATTTQTITVDDNINPTASNPATVTVPGGPAPAPNPAVVTDEADNCSTPVVAFVGDVSDGNPCPETITRTYSVTDACGNSITVTQLILITDPVLPTATAPAGVTVECIGDVPSANPLIITDEADNNGVPTVSFLSDVSNGATCPEIITRTYRVTDDCGNYIDVTQTITVHDLTAPVFASAPANVTVSCSADVPAMTNLSWTDNCDGTGSVAGSDVSNGGSCPEIITRTWTYTDDCGNVATTTQTITVHDLIAPLFAAAPANVTVSCSADIPAMTNLSWTDNCDGTGSVAGSDVSNGGSCPEIITRTWTYTDNCGNVATTTQTITVHDLIAPVFATAPANVTVSCVADVPAMTNLSWTDNCDGTGSVAGTDGALTGGACGGTITRTWTYTDDCGNVATTTQTITVDDNINPTASNPATITAPGGPAPAPDPLVVTTEADNCSTPVVAWVSDVSDGGACPETITRTYSVTDACGNSITVTQLILITDPIQPTASNPASISVECIANVPAADPTVVTDEADNGAMPIVTFESDASDGNTCPETITRTYRVTDDCGNFIFVTQTITVQDITVPVLAAAPANVTVSCPADVPAMTNLSWTDNCDGTGSVTGSDVSNGGSCPEIITRTWTYTDNCGNVATTTQTITVHDLIAPVFAAAPANVTVSCSADVPAMTNLSWTDNCDGTGSVAGSDVSNGGSCPEVITRTWTYTDNCGNVATTTQTITVHDLIAPVFAAAPANVTVSCVADVPAMTNLSWTDNCDGTGSVAGTDGALTGGACGGTITRTWTYTDNCGNVATTTQTITVDDNINPTASNPATVTVPGGPAPAPDPTVVTDEADNCSTPVVAFVGDVSDGNACPETITRTYSVTDACGNSITVTQLILITDPIQPTASNPASISVECIANVPAADPTVVTDEADNGAMPTVTFEGDASDGNTCPETITRTYRVTDDCGNFIFVTQTITVQDITAPTASNPASVSVECVSDIPTVDPTVVTDESDNCTSSPIVAFVNDISNGSTCPEVITRTYSVTDICGNQTLVTQTITIYDITAPTVTGTIAPTNVTGCSATSAPAAATTVATLETLGVAISDNCTTDALLTVTSSDASAGSCPIVVTRTYTISDACNNQVTLTQTFNIQDLIAPTVTGTIATTNITGCSAASAPTAVNTVADLEAMGVTIADNCTADASLTVTSSDASAGSCPIVVTRTYTITDACNNQVTLTQTFNIQDLVAPTVTGTITSSNVTGCSAASAPAAVTTVADLEAMGVDIADNCTVDASLTVTSSDASAGSCPIVVTRTYTITDACNNQVTLTQTFNIQDLIAPTVTGTIATTNVTGCSASAAPTAVTTVAALEAMGITIADNCTADASLTVTSSDASSGSCPIVVTRTYTISDACNNQVTLTQTFNIQDLIAPTITGTIAPTNVTGCSATSAPAAVTTVAALEAMGIAIADNCTADASLTVTSSDASAGSCPIVVTRNYTITDACNNQVTLTQTFNIQDLVAPTVTGTIATTNITGCSASAAPAAVTTVAALEAMGVTIADNCTADASLTVTSSDATAGSCPIVVTRTYTIRDACNNQVTLTQTFNIQDLVAPTVTGTIASSNVTGCSASSAPAAVTTVAALEALGVAISDNCTADASLTVTSSDASAGSCPIVVTRTYTITDACNNQVTLTQTFNIQDLIAPTITGTIAPTNITGCSVASAPAAVTTVAALEALGVAISDNCTTDASLTVTSSDASTGSCPIVLTRTYTITDSCNNQVTLTQTFNINDNVNPTASNPADIYVVSSDLVPPYDILVVTDEADNCSTPIVAWESDVSDNNVCNNEIITRTYSVTDDCGNQILVTQLIHITAVYPIVNAGPDNTICEGNAITLTASNPDNAVISWTSPVVNGVSFTPPLGTNTYTVTADNYGCISTDDVVITVEDVPVVSFSADVLSGCAPLQVTFTNTSTSASGLADCDWSFGNGASASGCGSVTYTYTSGGLYDVTLTTTSVTGCSNTLTINDYIYVESLPEAAFTASSTVLDNLDQYSEVIFDNNSSGATDYFWDFADGGSSSDENPEHSFLTEVEGGYNVMLVAISSLGCVDTAYQFISITEELIYFIPNTFTPDGNEYNQTFQPVFTSGFDPYNFTMLIYNRWGELIFESHDASKGWDGSYNGEKVQQGTYTWKVNFKSRVNDKTYTDIGHVNVLR